MKSSDALRAWWRGEPDNYGRWWCVASALGSFSLLYVVLLFVALYHDFVL